MLRDKHQNHSITFAKEPSGYKKYRKFIATFIVAIFLLGGGFAVYKHNRKPAKISQTENVSSDIPGWWYQKYFGSSVCEKDSCKPDADPDSDKLTNAQEYFYHTDPLNSKTVGDKLSDGQLVAQGFDPSRSGKMTFEQAASPDNILGESLLLDSDLKKLVAENNDISKVSLPLVQDSELTIIRNATTADFKNYLQQVKSILDKYFPQNSFSDTIDQLKNKNSDVGSIMSTATLVADELKKVNVPQQILTYHKYTIAMYQLLPQVLNPHDQGSDVWYDKAQAFFALSQKLNFEAQSLSKFISL